MGSQWNMLAAHLYRLVKAILIKSNLNNFESTKFDLFTRSYDMLK